VRTVACIYIIFLII